MTSADDRLLSSYDFDLPREAIAQQPVEPRHSARLLVVEPGQGARHRTVWDWPEDLRPGDLLVVNDTRVLQARLRARRDSGGAVEVLVLQPWAGAGSGGAERAAGFANAAAVAGEGGSDWLCLLKPAKRVRIGELLRLESLEGTPCDPPVLLKVVAMDPASGGRVVRFPAGLADAGAIEPFLQRHGTMPLPPYIHDDGGVEGERYQTRYAVRPGAVAAPTAGLHLSDALLERLQQHGVERAAVTLHVGLGTFRPLEQEELEGLELHSEWVEVSQELVAAVAAARARGGRVIAVGTTAAVPGRCWCGSRGVGPGAGRAGDRGGHHQRAQPGGGGGPAWGGVAAPQGSGESGDPTRLPLPGGAGPAHQFPSAPQFPAAAGECPDRPGAAAGPLRGGDPGGLPLFLLW